MPPAAPTTLLFPNRLALKQVHSQQNPEKDWGNDTLAAARYRAVRALNERYAGTPANPGAVQQRENTLVIAGSVSRTAARPCCTRPSRTAKA